MTTLTADISSWEPAQRRLGSAIVLGLAVVVLLAGIALWWFAGVSDVVYWTLVGLMVLVLALAVLIHVLQPRAAATQAAPEAHAWHAVPVESEPPAPAPATPMVLTLRCGDCGTVFEVTDTGERPLYHTCPGCGAEGALRDAVEATPAAEPEYAPPPPAPEEPVAAPVAPAPAKKIKLRCPGCKEVFSADDDGQRPLRTACPHCGRKGVIH